ncbi:MAG: hypothetical protein KAV87_51595 [Desulfobacteraceae bacterium]|nr:hypothetical protein [Desulfobacteraceae bacterium]
MSPIHGEFVPRIQLEVDSVEFGGRARIKHDFVEMRDIDDESIRELEEEHLKYLLAQILHAKEMVTRRLGELEHGRSRRQKIRDSRSGKTA